MWVEFVVDSLLCSERFFSGYSGFPLSLKTNTFKFQYIVLDYKFYLGFETEKRSASPQDRNIDLQLVFSISVKRTPLMCLVIKNATRFSWILFSGDSY